MTTILLSNTPFPVEVTYDNPGLFVGVSVYKWVASAWVLQGSILPAFNLPGTNTYGVVLVISDGAPYIVQMQPYTDNTYTTPSPDYSPSSSSFLLDPTDFTVIDTVLAAIVRNTQDLIGVVDMNS